MIKEISKYLNYCFEMMNETFFVPLLTAIIKHDPYTSQHDQPAPTSLISVNFLLIYFFKLTCTITFHKLIRRKQLPKPTHYTTHNLNIVVQKSYME